MTDHPHPEASEPFVIGRATTHGQALPLGVDDPVIAARAVRRALADARRQAADVETVAVATPPPLTLEAVRLFARRALGPFGVDVEPVVVEAVEPHADALVEAALRALSSARGRAGLGIAVGVASDGTTIALCLGAPRRER